MNIQVSAEFQKRVKKTLISIFIFIIVYLILLAVTIGITIFFGYIGIWAIINYPNILTIGLGLGLIAAGLTTLYFLIKFIFSFNKMDTRDLIEVKESEQPELFEMIHELVNEVKTEFPKKVFLSHNVNASVFYNSSFWSMFLPVRKNLQIGIGLINSLTKQELKAILAHEFGHFSQKSMKVGSYVYNVNSIIYNMLYNNDSINNLQNKIANLSGYIALTLSISTISINGIQKILQRLYDYININYMALSREMEFHADEISVNVSGSKALADGLLRLSFANYSLDSATYFYEKKIGENFLPVDIYQDQKSVSLFLAKKNHYDIVNGFPQISIDAGEKYNKSKLIIENQWASHPSTPDRVNAINRLNIIVENIDNSPAIEILRDKESLLQNVQNLLFNDWNHQGLVSNINNSEFQSQYELDYNKNQFDEIFNEFYTYNNPVIHDFSKISYETDPIDFSLLFSDQNAELSFEVNSLLNDKLTLEDISNLRYKLKTFDYDGVKYKTKDARGVLRRVEEIYLEKQNQLDLINNQIFETFYAMSKDDSTRMDLNSLYNTFKNMDAEFDEKFQFSFDISNHYSFVYQEIEFTDIVKNLDKNKPLESRLKGNISDFLKIEEIRSELSTELLESLTYFVENDLSYFFGAHYNDTNLNYLFTAIQEHNILLSRAFFFQKKKILNKQKEIYLDYQDTDKFLN